MLVGMHFLLQIFVGQSRVKVIFLDCCDMTRQKDFSISSMPIRRSENLMGRSLENHPIDKVVSTGPYLPGNYRPSQGYIGPFHEQATWSCLVPSPGFHDCTWPHHGMWISHTSARAGTFHLVTVGPWTNHLVTSPMALWSVLVGNTPPPLSRHVAIDARPSTFLGDLCSRGGAHQREPLRPSRWAHEARWERKTRDSRTQHVGEFMLWH